MLSYYIKSTLNNLINYKKMSDVSIFNYFTIHFLNTFKITQAVNPKPFLIELVNRKVSVRLKWGIDYQGILKSFDRYMNVQLTGSEEVIEGDKKGELGEILIRCNNILYIREISEDFI